MILQKYAEEHRLLNTQFYIDDGFSGADFNRPNFKRMMNDVESGKVGIVIVKDQSRLGRDYLQTGMLMEITFPQFDVRFIAINDGVDSAEGVSDFSGIKNYFNDFYARDTSRKTSRSPRGRAERSVAAALPVGTTAWWSVTFLLLQTWAVSMVPGVSRPQTAAAAETMAGTVFSISSVRNRLSVRG